MDKSRTNDFGRDILEEIEFLPAKTSNLKNLFEIGEMHFRDEKWLKMGFLEDSLHSAGYHFIARHEEKTIGGILVRKYDFPKNWIYYFVVHPDYQRRGIGTKLLGLAEAEVKRSAPGSNCLYVDIGTEDLAAKNFYFKNGFKNEGEVGNWFDEGVPAFILRKKLE